MRERWPKVVPFVRMRIAELNISDTEVARRIHISKSYLSRLLSGQQVPSWAVFVTLCEELRISMDSLLNSGSAKAQLAISFTEPPKEKVVESKPGLSIVWCSVREDAGEV